LGVKKNSLQYLLTYPKVVLIYIEELDLCSRNLVIKMINSKVNYQNRREGIRDD
jgi:hypothetical protein